MIDDRLAQVYSEEGENIVFLDERPAGGKINKLSEIRWNEYTYEKLPGILNVGDLRTSKQISEKEYMAVHWGPEEEANPYFRDGVKFFGQFKKKK